MTPDDFKQVIITAAGNHVAKLFEVLCSELASGADEGDAGSRFIKGVGIACAAAQFAIEARAKE